MTREEAARILRREIECLTHTKCSDCILEKVCDPNTTPLDSEYREIFEMAIKALEQEPCEDAISRSELLKAIDTWDRFGVDDTNSLFRLDNLSLPHYVPYIHYDDVVKCIKGMPSVTPKQKMGRWIVKEGREQGYDIAGIKTWYIQIMCDKCGFIKTAIEGHTGQYHYCPNCGAKMAESEEWDGEVNGHISR